jgi:8-oxo-dGTP pyrophosphatase MutT (NUDIX family)
VTDQHKFRAWAKEHQGTEVGDGPSELIPAATAIVVRDGEDGIEALMLRRNSKLAFAGGMWVFPGGRLDDEDRRPEDGPDELDDYRRAAVREAKEEADLDLDLDTLVPFSHWEPPPITPKRFSTWFFLAPAPSGSAAEVTIDDGEIHEWTWMRPAHALERRDRLEIELAPPTWVTLYELATCPTVADALAFCAGREPEHFTTKIALVDKDVIAIWHGDAGYGATLEEETDPHAEGPRHRLNMLDVGWTYERRS